MRWGDVSIDACAMKLGRLVPVQAAVVDGRYDPRFCEAHGYASVSDAGEATAVDLAAEATSVVLRRSTLDHRTIGLLVYASCVEVPGMPTPGSAVQARTLPLAVGAVEVRQGCNSGIAALQLAASVTAADEGSSVIMVTADKLRDGVDRYRQNPGAVSGDGAAALMLTRRPGLATLLSTVAVGDGRLEARPVPIPPANRNRAEFLAEQRRRLLPILRAAEQLQEECIQRALSEAGITSADIRRWVFAHSGRYVANHHLWAAFGATEADTTWDWGRTVGHLAAGDQIAGLVHLIESEAVQVGDHVALFGSGVGPSYGCAVVRINAKPSWIA